MPVIQRCSGATNVLADGNMASASAIAESASFIKALGTLTMQSEPMQFSTRGTRCNQRHRINCCPVTAKRNGFLVSWDKITRLTCNANLGDLLEEVGLGNLNGKSWNCLSLSSVARPRMAQSATAHLEQP